MPHISKMRSGSPIHQTALKSLGQSGVWKVDRSTLTIHGVTAMNEGEALGHFVWADNKTISQTVALLQGKRLPSRFGHTTMSENAMGKKVGHGVNWRVDGQSVRHDMQLLEAAKVSPVFGQDPVEYLLQMAEKSPEAMGESFVVKHGLAWLMEDGTDAEYLYRWMDTPNDYPDYDKESEDRRPLGAIYPYPSIRPTSFYSIDFVSDGALTHNGLYDAGFLASMFSGTSSEFASEMFQLIDQLRERYGIPVEDIPRKAALFMVTYLQMRGLSRDSISSMLAAQLHGVSLTKSMEANMLNKDDEVVDEFDEFDDEGSHEAGGDDAQASQFDELVEAIVARLGIGDLISVIEALSERVGAVEAMGAELAEIVDEVAHEGSLSAIIPAKPVRGREPKYAARLAALGAGGNSAAGRPAENTEKPKAQPLAQMSHIARVTTRAGRLGQYMERGG